MKNITQVFIIVKIIYIKRHHYHIYIIYMNKKNGPVKNINKKIAAKDDDTKSMIKELALEASNSGKVNKILDECVNNIDDNDDDDELSDLADDSNTCNDNINSKENEDISNEFKEKVITYLKCDDLIRKKMEEVKELKGKKKPCEEYIIKYLENKDSPFVKVKDGKLIKNKAESKGSLKVDLIKEAIMEGIKGEKLSADEVKSNDITIKIMEIMENKRAKTVHVNLKRTFQRNENNTKKK